MKLSIFVLTSLLSFPIFLNAQDHKVKNDTAYFVLIETRLDNGRPIYTQCIVKDLGLLNCSISNHSDFLCKLSDYAIYLDDPLLGFLKMTKYININKKKETILFQKELGRLTKRLRTIKITRENQQNELIISIAKIIGEFWILPTDFDLINSRSESIKISKDCYKFPYYYRLKKIIKTSSVSISHNIIR